MTLILSISQVISFLGKALRMAFSPRYSLRMKIRFFKVYVLGRLTGKKRVASLEVVNTLRCNARCSFCSLAGMSDFKSDMKPEVFRRIVEEAAREGVTLITFLGGEALLKKDFFENLKACWERGIPTALQTNGTLLTEARLNKLKESHVQDICITMHGDSPESHDKVYGSEGAFERVIDAIEFARKNGMQITLKAIYSKQTIEDGTFQRILDLAERFDLNLNVNPIMPVGSALDSGGRLGLQEIESFRQLLKTNPRLSSHVYKDGKVRGCFAGVDYFAVFSNGDLLPCYFLPVSVGNIMELSLREAHEIIMEIPIFAERMPVCFIAESGNFYSKVLKPLYENYPDLPVNMMHNREVYDLLKGFSLESL